MSNRLSDRKFAIAGIILTAFALPAHALSVPAPSGSWRPFSDDSPWNTNIETAPLQAAGSLRGFTTHDSGTYINFLNERAVYSAVSASRWTIPVYFVDGTTPGVMVGFTGEADYEALFLNAMNPVPIPSEAVSDPGDSGHYPPLPGDIIPDTDITDAHMCIIDLSTGSEYDFWHMARDTQGNWRASAGIKLSIHGDGVITEGDLQAYSYARGTAVPLSVGLLWRNEIAAGEIRHALAMSIPSDRNRQGFYVWPGQQTDGYSPDSRALPEGARLRLRWSEEEIEQRYQSGQITNTGRIIARALRRYGAINVDNGGNDHLTFYAQNFSDTSGSHNGEPENWGGLLNMDKDGYADDIAVIRASDFEVIRFEYGRDGVQPAITANGSSSSLSIVQGEALSVAAQLSPGSRGGEYADWWAAAESPFGLYWYGIAGGWEKSDAPTAAYSGRLFNLPPYPILQSSALPAGSYTFYFGIDLLPDGDLDYGQLYFSSVDVTITP